uniref:interferon alpha-inducible protein 27-like protein 2A n=1 Tax=Scatophagus argus TaxID=75038 RepID=UPI001ED80EAC|nr:interferon alpha-inducible protein 27-like protein 2A [Scatophagus argus]
MEDICYELIGRSCEEMCKVLVVGGGGALTVALTPALLTAIGFTSGGIAASSLAAKMMAWAATANGGGVAAGSLVAWLQSLGAAGLTGTATGVAAGAGGTMGWLLSTICNQTVTP